MAAPESPDARDYDAEAYVRLLRETYASRVARAFSPEDYETLFADPLQMSLFTTPLASIRPILTRFVVETHEPPA